MAKLVITIDSEDDGMDDQAIAHLVRGVALKIVSGHEGGKIMSHNGNSVGKWEYERTETHTECDECGARIPVECDSEVNEFHEKHCSLHPDNVEEELGGAPQLEDGENETDED